MTIGCLFVHLFLEGLDKYYWLEFNEKNQKMSLGPSHPNFETDLDHRLDTKRNPDFPIYLSLHALAEVCTLQVLLFCLLFLPHSPGCRGIVFTHGVRMGGRAGGRQEKVCPGCISETIRCRKLILGRDIGQDV